MIITNLKGGLGNQLFQYAFGKHLSIKNDCKLLLTIDNYKNYKLHNGFELERVFEINENICSNRELRNMIGLLNPAFFRNVKERVNLPFLLSKNTFFERTHEYMEASSEIKNPKYLHGYWQSEKYFKGSCNAMREILKFRHNNDNFDSNLLTTIHSENSIAIHVRRGDYLSTKNSSIYTQLPIEYYKRAFEIIGNKVLYPVAIIFSDDVEWSRQLFHDWPSKKVFIEGNNGLNSFKDMQLMSLCKHQIIANSSFSWWGAWLNNSKDKIVVAPKQWFQKKTTTDIYADGWIKL